MAERARNARRYIWVVVLAVLFLGLTWYINARLETQRSTAEHDRVTLAQQASVRDQQIRDLAAQVRRMGGTPVVSPPPGPAGSPGQPGASGSQGRPGVAGKSGQPGASVTGPPGKTGPTGASVTGPPGPVGPAGSAGKDGKDGADGKPGSDGKDGSPPSSWTWTDQLGTTYTCTRTSPGATTYDCQPSGPLSARRKK